MSDDAVVSAVPSAASEHDNDGSIECLLFELAGECYAAPLERIDEVIKVPPVTPVPNAPSVVAGIFHLRGRVIVVVDLAKLLRLPRETLRTPSFLFTAHRDRNVYGVLVDRVKRIVRIPLRGVTQPSELVTAHVPSRMIRGVVVMDEDEPRPVRSTRSEGADILITPQRGKPDETPEEALPPRPVLLLDLEALLSQEEVVRAGEGVATSDGEGVS